MTESVMKARSYRRLTSQRPCQVRPNASDSIANVAPVTAAQKKYRRGENMDRRAFFVTGTAALAACSSPGTTDTAHVPGTPPAGTATDWEWVRTQFALAPDHVHMSSFL
jgi:hypothetical protein